MKNASLFALLGGLAVVACGSSSSDAAPPGATDTTPTEPPGATPPGPAGNPMGPGADPKGPGATPPKNDPGGPSSKYPAFTPAMGQLVDNGGTVLKQPVIYTVTWVGDPKASDLETLGDTIGTGDFWKDTVSEYGAGPATSGTAQHIRLSEPAPRQVTNDELDAFVADKVAKGTFPAPGTGDPVYILYLPTTTSLLVGNGKNASDACKQGIGGYHANTKGGSKTTAYAIVPRCGSSFDSVTLAGSHELVEAASDPYPSATPGWVGFRDQDLAWEFFQQFQSENGDACEFYRDSPLDPALGYSAYTLQRSWSNKSAAAGHDPCVPAFKSAPFFNVTPLGLEDISVDLSSLYPSVGIVNTKGVQVAVGATRTIPLGFYSDAATPPWKISARLGGPGGGAKSGVDLSLDVKEGENGQMANLTIKVNAAGKTGTQLITIVSTSKSGGTSHYMPILIGSMAK